jgi:hypothetical protein
MRILDRGSRRSKALVIVPKLRSNMFICKYILIYPNNALNCLKYLLIR